MEQQKESMESIIKRAPKGATHHTYPYTFKKEVFWNWDNLIELPKHTDRWKPEVGEIILFKRNDSIDYAYDSPERMEVVAIVGDKVWLKNALRDMVTNLDNISPLEKEKSLREELIDIMSCGGRWDYMNVDQAADRLIAAGIKLEGMQ